MRDPAQSPQRLAVFGDSHYACLRLAHNDGLVDLTGFDIEYWGHVGQRFRMLEYRDGAIHPTDDVTAARFARFNEKGRMCLPAQDFDAILFMGCRIDLAWLFLGLVDAEMRGAYPSLGLRHAMLAGRLAGAASYGFAKSFAALGQARILLHPVTLFANGAPDYDALMTEDMRRATPAARQKVWQFFTDYMADDGITLLPQLDHTFVNGVYTDPIYKIGGLDDTRDFTHRSAGYGALVYHQMIAALSA